MSTSKSASAASRAAATKSGAGGGAALGTDEDAGATLGAGVRVTLDVAAPGADQIAGPRGECGEGYAALAVGLLDAGRVQVFQDDGCKVLLSVVAGLGLGQMVDEFVILVDAEGAVRRQALHCERAGDADDAPILVLGLSYRYSKSPWQRSMHRSPSAAQCVPPTSGGGRRLGRRPTVVRLVRDVLEV